jgi:hypothetical protein
MTSTSLRQCWLSGLGVCVLHCALLQPSAAAGDAGSGTNRAQGGAAEPDSAGGAAAEPGSNGGSSTLPHAPPLVDGCADLDTDGVSDCSVTLVDNPTFESNVSGWKALDAATLTWNDGNALGDEPSGCALLRATGALDVEGSTLVGATQCVAVPTEMIIVAYANVRVPLGQAELEVSFFASDECQGDPSSHFSTPPSTAVDEWVTIQAGGLSGRATKSASVALLGIKPNRAEEFEACFDNVMLSPRPL